MNARIQLDVLITRICLVGVFLGLGVVVAFGYSTASPTFSANAAVRTDFLKNSLNTQTLQLVSDALIGTLAASASSDSVLAAAALLDPAGSISTLRAGLGVQIPPQTNLLVITERADTPTRAAAAANAVAQAVVNTELQMIAAENAAREKPLRDTIADSQTRITSLQSQVDVLMAQLPDAAAGTTTLAITTLQSRLATEQQTQLVYKTQLAALLATELQQAPSVLVAAPAEASAATAQPNRLKLLGGGAAAGFAVGLLLAALITPRRLRLAWRTWLSDGAAAAATSAALTIREVEASPLWPNPAMSKALVAELGPIWSDLVTQMGAQPLRLVVVTGVDEDVGAGQFANALATYAATAGTRVALVEANLERPTVRSWSGDAGGPDLMELLTEAASDWPAVHAALRPTSLPGLFVLPATRAPGMQTLVLGSTAMDRVIDALLREPVDLVVISCPPLTEEANVGALAARAGRVFVVSGERRVSAEKAERVTSLSLISGRKAITLVITAPRRRVAPSMLRAKEIVSRRVALAPMSEG